MTLEQLKEANQNKVWAWKEKDMTDIQNYITAYDDLAPNTLKAQQQKLKDLDEEERVLESLTKDKDTEILVQIRVPMGVRGPNPKGFSEVKNQVWCGF